METVNVAVIEESPPDQQICCEIRQSRPGDCCRIRIRMQPQVDRKPVLGTRHCNFRRSFDTFPPFFHYSSALTPGNE